MKLVCFESLRSEVFDNDMLMRFSRHSQNWFIWTLLCNLCRFSFQSCLGTQKRSIFGFVQPEYPVYLASCGLKPSTSKSRNPDFGNIFPKVEIQRLKVHTPRFHHGLNVPKMLSSLRLSRFQTLSCWFLSMCIG